MFPCLKECRICSIIIEQHAQKILGLADRVMILERGTIADER
jgi:branched-chain amino acid transport system ATP-binding protein